MLAWRPCQLNTLVIPIGAYHQMQHTMPSTALHSLFPVGHWGGRLHVRLHHDTEAMKPAEPAEPAALRLCQVRVMCPDVEEQEQLNGQLLEVEVSSLTDTVGDMKARALA